MTDTFEDTTSNFSCTVVQLCIEVGEPRLISVFCIQSASCCGRSTKMPPRTQRGGSLPLRGFAETVQVQLRHTTAKSLQGLFCMETTCAHCTAQHAGASPNALTQALESVARQLDACAPSHLNDTFQNQQLCHFLNQWEKNAADVPIRLCGTAAAQEHCSPGSWSPPEWSSDEQPARWWMEAPPLWLPGSAQHKYSLLLWPLQDILTAPRFTVKASWRWMWAWAGRNWRLSVGEKETTCDFSPDSSSSPWPAWGTTAVLIERQMLKSIWSHYV